MKLKFYRNVAKLTQKEVASYLKVAESTYSLYENEKRKIGFEELLKLGELYGVTVDELLGNKKSASPEGNADNLINQIYKDLNDHGRAELERYGNYLRSQDVYKRVEAEPHVEYIRHYLVPAAAGYASPIEGEDYELIPLDPKAPRGADYCITIRGDSMMPFIGDGDLVYVKRGADMTDFDVGVFYVDGDVLCKQYCVDAYRNLHLLSANSAREDANRTIKADSMSRVMCFGKVLLPHKLPQPVYL
jgi:transcriptional regulator with XRE-family HTH domain